MANLLQKGSASFSSIPVDRDALPVRLHLRDDVDDRVRAQEGLQGDHLHDARLRQHLAQGHLPAAQRRLFNVTLHHAGHRY